LLPASLVYGFELDAPKAHIRQLARRRQPIVQTISLLDLDRKESWIFSHHLIQPLPKLFGI